MARVPRTGASELPAAIAPMLASPDGGRLPDGPAYAYEYKWDFCTWFRPVGPRVGRRQRMIMGFMSDLRRSIGMGCWGGIVSILGG